MRLCARGQSLRSFNIHVCAPRDFVLTCHSVLVSLLQGLAWSCSDHFVLFTFVAVAALKWKYSEGLPSSCWCALAVEGSVSGYLLPSTHFFKNWDFLIFYCLIEFEQNRLGYKTKRRAPNWVFFLKYCEWVLCEFNVLCAELYSLHS